MAYVAPTTQSANTKLTSATWNQSVNNMIDVNARATGIAPGLYSARPASATVGQTYYQTDTDELVKYVTDLDATNKWMQASPEYRRNFVINGGFDVWQRNNTFNPISAITTTGLNYACDRWQFLQATTSTAAFTRQAITATDPVGYNYYTRVQRVAAATLVTPYTIQTSFESQNIQNIRGKYVTLSFWARAGANYSAASAFLVSNIVTGTGTDNTLGNFTTNTVNTTTNNVLTASWKRFSVTTSAVIATTITQLGVSFAFTPVGTAGAADYYDITGVQLEIGTAPSDFEFRDAGEELRRCQRYYYQMGPYASGGYGSFGTGFAINTTTIAVNIPYPVTMRIAPATLATAAAAQYGNFVANTITACNIAPNISGTEKDVARIQGFVASGMTAGGGAMLLSNLSTTAFLGFSAEL